MYFRFVDYIMFALNGKVLATLAGRVVKVSHHGQHYAQTLVSVIALFDQCWSVHNFLCLLFPV